VVVQQTENSSLGQAGISPHTGLRPGQANARESLRHAVARLDEAEHRGNVQELVEALLPVASCYRAMGALAAAEDTLRQALRSARRSACPQQLVRVLAELAHTACTRAEQLQADDAASARAARDRARDEAFEASALTHRHAQAAWATPALLEISDILNRCGDHDDATALQTRALEWMALRSAA
jgi:tetratricopeptide (TPR) repeat protein